MAEAGFFKICFSPSIMISEYLIKKKNKQGNGGVLLWVFLEVG